MDMYERIKELCFKYGVIMLTNSSQMMRPGEIDVTKINSGLLLRYLTTEGTTRCEIVKTI